MSSEDTFNSKNVPVKSLTFTYLSLLLKTANHAALLIPDASTSELQVSTAREICERVLSHCPEFVDQTRHAAFRTLSDPKYCGKMAVLAGLLRVFRKERSKVLLFSYSTR
ncbi:PREDICTED: DNA excision repair protein ERCC-6-like 2, partial [Priapulus caudatus]|uniref:DNA excision repair protein ERCC-6-like 2 n=1 Tax=Priapulus caudatus TaxID=37621 RepID=A0ABM1F641_PRICU